MRSIAVSDSLNIYLAQIEQFPLLTPMQEHDLAVRVYDNKDLDAAKTLITSNLRFVVKIALEYREYVGARRAVPLFLDLIQEGNIGLMKAVRRFNPYKGYRLISYAVWWIRAQIQAFIMKMWSIVKIGTTQAQRKLFYNLNKIKDSLSGGKETFGREDHSLEDSKVIAQKLNVKDHEAFEMELRMAGRDFSLDVGLNDGKNSPSHLDILPTDGANQEEALVKREEQHLIKREMHEALQKLSSTELFIIRNRYLTEHALTLQEIGDRLSISRERVRQIEERTIKKLRENVEHLPTIM